MDKFRHQRENLYNRGFTRQVECNTGVCGWIRKLRGIKTYFQYAESKGLSFIPEHQFYVSIKGNIKPRRTQKPNHQQVKFDFVHGASLIPTEFEHRRKRATQKYTSNPHESYYHDDTVIERDKPVNADPKAIAREERYQSIYSVENLKTHETFEIYPEQLKDYQNVNGYLVTPHPTRYIRVFTGKSETYHKRKQNERYEGANTLLCHGVKPQVQFRRGVKLWFCHVGKHQVSVNPDTVKDAEHKRPKLYVDNPYHADYEKLMKNTDSKHHELSYDDAKQSGIVQ